MKTGEKKFDEFEELVLELDMARIIFAEEEEEEEARIVVSMKDITERKRAEEALRESEQRYRALFKSTLDGVFVIDAETMKVVLANEAVANIFGFDSVEETIGINPLDFIAPEDRDRVIRIIAEDMFAKDLHQVNEFRAMTKDGREIWIRAVGARIEYGGKLAGLVSIHEITEIKKAQEALERERNLLRTVIDIMPDTTIYVKDRECRKVLANRADLHTMGVKTEAEVLGKTDFEFYPKELAARFYAEEQAIIKTGQPIFGCEGVVLAEGQPRWFLSSKVPLRDSSGQVVGLVGVGLDITERKLAEERYKTIVQTSMDGIWVMDMRGRFLDVNDAYCRLIGYSRDELLKMSIPDVEVIEKPEETDARIQKIMKTGSDRFETRHRCKDGRIVDVEVSVSYLNVEGGRLFVFLRDITERKLAEEALSLQQAYFQQLFDNSPDAIVLLDNTDRVVQVNKGFETLFGYWDKEVKGRFINELVIPEDRIEEASALSQAGINNKARRKDTVRKRKDGSLVDVDAFGYPIQFGNKTVGVYTIYNDITERKQADMALRESEERFRSLLESSADSIYLLDRDIKFLYANEKILDRYKKSLEEVIGQHYSNLHTKEESKEFGKIFNKVLESKKPITYEYISKRDGRCFLRTLSPILDIMTDEVMAITVISKDITEHRRLQEEVLKTQKLESIGVLASGIAHDFNNILSVILGNIQLAKMKMEKGEDISNYLNTLERTTARATGLTYQLLTFSKGGSPDIETASMKDLIQESVPFSLTGSNIKYIPNIDEDLSYVEMDANQISQVITNIVINARQAMPDGGRFFVSALNTKVDDENPVGTLKKGKYVEVSIRDEGIGIPEKIINRIFDPFFTTKSTGNGLGLSTCYSIINKHNGYITVSSKPGKGSTFTFYLPASEKKVEKVEIEKGILKLEGRILVMDDQESARELMKAMLNELGCEVETVSNGEEAISKYKEAKESNNPFDLVIFDLTTPGGMGGKVAIKKLKSYDKSVKAVAYSGYTDDPVISNPGKFGFIASFSKPFQFKKLAKVLKRALL